MRISALNSFNFTGRNNADNSEHRDYTPDYDYEYNDTFETDDTEDEVLSDNVYEQKPSETPESSKASETNKKSNITSEDIKKYVETVKKAGKDVKLPTIIGAGVTFAAILAKGMNVTRGIINTAALISEKACNTAIGVAGKLTHSTNTSSAQQKISKTINNFIANGEDTKMLEGIKDVADKICASSAEGKASLGDNITGAMKKFGIVNVRDIISLAGAGTVAAATANGAADKFENALDKKQIDKAKEELEGKQGESGFFSNAINLFGFSNAEQAQEKGYEVIADVATALAK